MKIQTRIIRLIQCINIYTGKQFDNYILFRCIKEVSHALLHITRNKTQGGL